MIWIKQLRFSKVHDVGAVNIDNIKQNVKYKKQRIRAFTQL